VHAKEKDMKIFSKLLVGAAGVGMAMTASSGSAQGYYPQPQYNPGYSQGGVVGQVISQVLGGGRYGAYGQGADRVAVDQCARAVETRVSGDNRRGVYGRWNSPYGYQGYNGANNQGYGHAQVVGITGVERRQSGLKVSGLIDTRMGTNVGSYGQYNQYGQAYPAYPNQGYPAYPNQGYGQPGYGNMPYNAAYADLRFTCRVDYRGQVTELRVNRNNRRG
jgi:hypothetical protein